ncbi:MAG: flap endonuclease-1 [Candidatus Woesearchaeota archaeon]|nr:MAG: flap endonuclease-1 [Candidatus Woesearchaeota archaeon]
MGSPILGIVNSQELKLEDLRGKVIAVDAFNTLYMFLTTIRGPDGTPLKDSKGNVTSHLSGLFSRFTTLLHYGVRPVFVFDGKAPDLKREERERRKAIKVEAQKQFDAAEQARDLEGMRKFASRTATLSQEMISEAKCLLLALGIPFVDAPSEGEAQAAYMVKKGDAFAVVSQDADALLFGAPRVIKNLSISFRRKMPGTSAYKTVMPELIELKEVLSSLSLSGRQLLLLGILVGTDFNRGGIKGIGPKKALKLVKEFGEDAKTLFTEAKAEFDWEAVINVFDTMPVTDEYVLEFRGVNGAEVKRLLCDGHEFSEERVSSVLERLAKTASLRAQKSIFDY